MRDIKPKPAIRAAIVLLLSVPMLFALTVPARANYVLSWIIIGSVPIIHIPFGLGALLVLLSEAIVFKFYFRLRWFHAVLASIGLNIISTLLGLIVGTIIAQTGAYSEGTSTLILLVVLLVMIFCQIKRIPWPVLALCLVLGFVGLFAAKVSSSQFSVYEPLWVKIILYGSPLLIAFALSVLIENLFARPFIRQESTWKGILRANAISYFLLVGLMLIYGGHVETEYLLRSTAPMSRAKGMLRSFASAQSAYQHMHGVYGTFDELVDEGFILSGNSMPGRPDRLSDVYFTEWECNNISVVPPDIMPKNSPNTFTIIAYPDPMFSDEFLNTFAVTEDQVVRVYNPDEGNVFESVPLWDPIL